MKEVSSLLRTSRLHREKAYVLRQRKQTRTLLEVVFVGHPQNQADLKRFTTMLNVVHQAVVVRSEEDLMADRTLVRATMSAYELQRVNAPGWSVLRTREKAAQ